MIQARVNGGNFTIWPPARADSWAHRPTQVQLARRTQHNSRLRYLAAGPPHHTPERQKAIHEFLERWAPGLGEIVSRQATYLLIVDGQSSELEGVVVCVPPLAPADKPRVHLPQQAVLRILGRFDPLPPVRLR